ncbi:MAG: sugar ABC transporter substrate-binding protein [Planctomycetes bacterium]|nr:sugar ABC transporter substrate-binding protein [Planctomycetota bacterium]
MRRALLGMVLVLCLSVSMAGETIRVVANVHPWTDGIKTLIPEFEKETGITVQLETYGEDQLNQKVSVEFTASRGRGIDVFCTRPLQEGRMMQKNGWYEDLTPYFKDDADYDFADFTPGSIDCTFIGGIQTCIPLVTEVELLFYRKDILAEHGLNPPKTFEELESQAKQLHDPANGFAGFVARGQRSALITQFSSYMYGFGTDFFDLETKKSLVDTPEFKEAANFYGGMLNKYGPEGVLNMHWMQAVAVFTQGKAALYTEASSLYPSLLDPTKSALADQTGVAVFPRGPRGHHTYDITAWGLAMSSGSSKKDAAWKFIRFMTNKKNTIVTQGQFMNPCARQSVYKIPEGVANFPPDWVQAMADSSTIGIGRDRPAVTAVGEARDIIGEVVVAAIEGQDIEPVAKRADARFQEILDRED